MKSGLAVLGGSVTPGARVELPKGCLGALSPSVPLLGHHGRLSLLEQCLTAMTDGPVWLIKSHSGFVAWALQGIPISCQLQGSWSQSNKGLDTRCIPRYPIVRQLFCLNSVLWEHLKPHGDVGSQGWMMMWFTDDWEGCCHCISETGTAQCMKKQPTTQNIKL